MTTSEPNSITVFVARKIITMNASQPVATAVAVRDGTILSVGSLEDLKPWLDGELHEIDRTFEDQVVLPGFIDPHLHASLGVTLNTRFITPDDWDIPGELVKGVRGRDAYLARLREIESELADPDEPLWTWGYHHLFHERLVRADLDAISSTRPIFVWHRSGHEMILNSRALELAALRKEDFEGNAFVDFAQGHFWEAGFLTDAMVKLGPMMLAPKQFEYGLTELAQIVQRGGITTIAELSFGVASPALELAGARESFDHDRVPFRTFYVADVQRMALAEGIDATVEWARSLPHENTHRLRFLKSVKLFADGAFFSQAMQLGEPGYIDGHDGEWMTPPETFERLARAFWEAGFKIHVHTNGDLGVALNIEVLQRLQDARPRFDHRYTLEHVGYCTPDQVRKLSRLGAVFSCNPYYVHLLGDLYAELGLGPDRAAQMVRLGTAVREGIPVALHSDFPVAPARPLFLAWIAANRRTLSSKLVAEAECLTVDQALRAITIDAAFILGVEDEIGSIVAGKTADFTVLGADPEEVGAEGLKDIPVWGTVFEGRVVPVPSG